MKNTSEAPNYQYRLPENFCEQNPEFENFKKVPFETVVEPQIKFLKKVRISTNSVIFRYFEVFRDSCISEENYQSYSKGFKFFIKFIFPKFNFSKKRFIIITDEWTSNYYHWHVFALTKLMILKKQNLLENSLLFLPKRYSKYNFVLPSLEKLGVKKNQIIFLRRKSNIKVQELAYVKCGNNNPFVIGELSQNLVSKVNLDFGDKIYVSRCKQALRFIENEDEVFALLAKYGFKKLLMENLSYDEQIAVSSKAKYIVSPHGAGLTNILFMPKNSALLEMVSDHKTKRLVTEYFRLANMLNIKYYFQECKMGPSSKVMDFHHASLVVNLAKLEKNLQLMLKNE